MSHAAVLSEIDQRLRAAHRTASLGNKLDPLDELIFIQLSIRTREQTYSSLYDELYRLVGGQWERLLEMPPSELLPVLRSGGMAEVKFGRLRVQLIEIREAFGRVTLDPLRAMDDRDAESFLRKLPGVGPKTARCVLLYSLQRAVFPVDSHCRRILQRLGFMPAGMDRKLADDVLQDLVPRPLRHDLHVNLVHHGRTICLPTHPRCGTCPLIEACPTGRERVRPQTP